MVTKGILKVGSRDRYRFLRRIFPQYRFAILQARSFAPLSCPNRLVLPRFSKNEVVQLPPCRVPNQVTYEGKLVYNPILPPSSVPLETLSGRLAGREGTSEFVTDPLETLLVNKDQPCPTETLSLHPK